MSGDEKGLAKHYTENNEAYQLYMKGSFYWNKRTAEGLHKAVDYFNKPFSEILTFALAYSGLADTYSLLGGPEAGGDMSPNERLPKAKAAALKALEIDESLAEPTCFIGTCKLFYDRDWAVPNGNIKKPLNLIPTIRLRTIGTRSIYRPSEDMTRLWAKSDERRNWIRSRFQSMPGRSHSCSVGPAR